jgi:ATP-dependent Clp protease ATP-binding subunit ClpB
MELSDEAKVKLAEEGFDPVLGARPLKRVIQKRIQNVLALRILRGEFKEGDRVLVNVGPRGEFEFTRQTAGEAKPEAV